MLVTSPALAPNAHAQTKESMTPTRRHCARLAIAFGMLAAATAGACSAGPNSEDPSAATTEALGHTAPITNGFPSLWSASAPDGGLVQNPICNYAPVDIPPNLAGKGCTTGGIIHGEPVWACPKQGLVVPSRIGQVGLPVGLPTCAHDPSTGHAIVPDGGACEAVYAVTATTNECLASPSSAWVYVWDHKEVYSRDGTHSCDSMGCGGPCPVQAQTGPY